MSEKQNTGWVGHERSCDCDGINPKIEIVPSLGAEIASKGFLNARFLCNKCSAPWQPLFTNTPENEVSTES